MKKILFFLLANGLLTAQTSELLSTNWYIAKIVTNGQTENTPAIDTGVPTSNFNPDGNNGYTFNSRYYNTSVLSLGFVSGTNNFMKTGSACTLAYYMGNNATAVNSYDQKNCNLFITPSAGAQYTYQIVNNGNVKTLIITDPSGNQVHYNNAVLETKENITAKKSLSLYPNPVKEILTIDHIDKNLSVKIFDLSGKLIYQTISKDKKIDINTNILQKGQYLITVENYQTLPFIKE
ncbi:T9SS type A sorting domain-containing protein [Chryseobacterium sp. JUb7]|uniref:T9SS type A sorting domain-containing protein n=1 Tax=Chryseobacterium sp. JUb7 TaxID=2940599 RepID=UPI002166CFBC|nr:T9SS type A sorting domain-containing protein [Chryseobacterium sp. JUb7]MCS3529211.1 hypothetical protein [Chryseobacterium sp. JUb7]